MSLFASLSDGYSGAVVENKLESTLAMVKGCASNGRVKTEGVVRYAEED